MLWAIHRNYISSLCTCKYNTISGIKTLPVTCIPGPGWCWICSEWNTGHCLRASLWGMVNNLLGSSRVTHDPVGIPADSLKGSKMIPNELDLQDAVSKL